jgi:hypothetical protein
MPKKPRKIHVGGRVWNAQKEKDAAAWQEQKAADPEIAAKKARERAKRAREEAKRYAWDRAKEHEERRQEKEEERRKEKEQEQETVRRPLMTVERHGHLKVLGLTGSEENISTINKAYREMALKYHPDRNGSVSALAMMKLINNAHDYLTK